MGGRSSSSGFREDGSKLQAGSATAAAASGRISPEAQAYLDAIGDRPDRVKYQQIRSEFREDGVFLTQDETKQEVMAALGVGDSSIGSIRFVSIPDNNGYVDAEVRLEGAGRWTSSGGFTPGVGPVLRFTPGSVSYVTIRLKIMNI